MTTYLWFTELFRLGGPMKIKDMAFRRELVQNTMHLTREQFIRISVRWLGF